MLSVEGVDILKSSVVVSCEWRVQNVVCGVLIGF